uniref:Uncharacterized protein n=1 Tax=Arundo donax TaxID=35708 RepID=A0A0A8XQ35_ARUDO
MASDAAKPRRFDLTMSRRTRRPASLAMAADCHQGKGMEGSKTMTHPQQQEDEDVELKAAQSQCPCSEDHLRPQHSEDAEEHKSTSEQSEDTEEQTAPQKCMQQEEEETQQQCQDNSRRFSLQELIEDESLDGDKDAATGNQEDKAAAAAVHEVAEPAGARKEPEHVAGRRVIGMMRRYVRVRPIKPKHAPQKNVAPIC